MIIDNPLMYRQFIEEYYSAYLLIKEQNPSPVEFFFVKSFLLGRIIELIFKTELIIKGHGSEELRKKENGGHDLIKLLTLLCFPDEYNLDATTHDAIVRLNNYYMEKKYEYPQTEDVEIRNVAFLEAFINNSNNKLNFKLNEHELLKYSG